MLLMSWLSGLKNPERTHRSSRNRQILKRHSATVSSEQLEVRLVLSAFTVINTDDNGVGSLRQAVIDANANVGTDVIQFASGVSGTIALTSGELTITDAVDLQGPGSSVVTVSGNNMSRVFFVSSTATISGLTITAGNADAGGGIYNSYGILTVESCLLSGNSTSNSGGGIFNTGTLTVDNSTLNNNLSYAGGGIFNWPGSTATVQNSTLINNSGSQYGGGILNHGSLTVDSSTFSGNFSAYGGGINNEPDCTATVQNSTFSGNQGGNFGGGIYNRGPMIVDSSTFSGNSGGYSGAISNNGNGVLTVQSSTLNSNSGTHQGGGIDNRENGTLTVVSSTLSGNRGVGIFNNSSGTSTLNNTIVAANFDEYGTPNDIEGAVAGGSSHNLIGVSTGLSGISNGSSGNQVGTAAAPINPMLGALQDNGGPTATMALLPGSPAFNAGDNSLIPVSVTTDQRGSGYARIENGTVDIGAYEFVIDNDPSTFIVTNLADNGLGSLRRAILNANANLGADIIQFVSGLTGTILLTSGELAITTDAIDVQGPGAGVITVSGNNASRVFRVIANATISGLTIAGGNADNGGGIYNAFGTLTVRNSTFSGNSAGNGGGILNAYGALTVVHSIFSGNVSSGSGYYGPGYAGGGGIYNANYGTQTTIQNSSFIDNSTAFAGGGVYNQGTLIVEGSTVSGNSTSYDGGGIFNWGTLAVLTSTLSGNSAGGLPGSNGAGGAILNFNRLTVDRSTFTGNFASYQGGGIYNRGASTLMVDRSTFTGNSAYLYGGAILSDGTLIVDRSVFSNNSAAFGGGINNNQYGNAYATMTVRNSTLVGNSASNSGGGFYNRGTLTLESSTLSGNSTQGFGGGIENFSGTLTVQNSTLSGNSAAYGGGIHNWEAGTLIVNNSTLSSNSDWGYGGGIYTRGTSTLQNNIVAANLDSYGTAYDIDGVITSSSSHNLIGVDTNLTGISHGSNGNQVGTAAVPINPMLGALQDNGGPTATMALLPGSPAFNAGDSSLIPVSVTTDQRGSGYARIENGTVDIGAYELIVNRPPTAVAGGPYSVTEGGSVALDGSLSSDPDQTTQTLLYAWDLDDDGIFGESGANAGRGNEVGVSPTFSAVGLDGPSTFTVSLRVTDSYGQSDITNAVMAVTNVAPTVTALSSSNADLTHVSATGNVTINGAFFDPALSLDTYIVQVNWGDGQPVETLPAAAVNQLAETFLRTHHYSTGGIFTITVTVLDEDGGVSGQSTSTAVVTGVGLVNGTLYIIGTNGNDHVNLHYKQNRNQLKVDVKLNQGGSDGGSDGGRDCGHDNNSGRSTRIRQTFQASSVNRIVAYLLDGNDHYNGGSYGGSDGGADAANIPMSQTVFGGTGNDQIQGGLANDILIGGSGDDEINGGSGRDILIGGLGKDTLHGNAGDDILIGGTTANQDYLTALDQALADWSTGNVNATLVGLGAITDDHEKDKLWGELGTDYLYGGVGDKLKQ